MKNLLYCIFISVKGNRNRVFQCIKPSVAVLVLSYMGKFTRKFLNYTKALPINFHLRRKKFEKPPNLEKFSTSFRRAARGPHVEY